MERRPVHGKEVNAHVDKAPGAVSGCRIRLVNSGNIRFMDKGCDKRGFLQRGPRYHIYRSARKRAE
ncbi:MAG: hypothetical protein ACFFBD_27055 [Candidatus Hodarchaeota archaeon]